MGNDKNTHIKELSTPLPELNERLPSLRLVLPQIFPLAEELPGLSVELVDAARLELAEGALAEDRPLDLGAGVGAEGAVVL